MRSLLVGIIVILLLVLAGGLALGEFKVALGAVILLLLATAATLTLDELEHRGIL